MKRLLGRLLLLAVGLAAGVVSAQPLLSYAPATDSLDRKWEWALQTIAENDNDGWLVWQVRTSLDEKIDTRNGFGYGEYIRWNSQSRYINFGGNGSWRSGLSIVALQAGNESPQQDFSRQRDLLLVFEIRGGTPRQLLLTDPSRPLNWNRQTVAWLGETSLEQSFQRLASLLDYTGPANMQRQLIRALGMHAVADRSALLNALYETPDWASVAPYLVESLALQKAAEVEALLLSIAQDENGSITSRRVAISALSLYNSELARQTLISLTARLNPTGIRVEALESLGMFNSPDTVDLLRNLVFEEGNEAVQEQALQSLAWLPGQFASIAEVAHLHGNSKLREEAVEELAALDMAAAMEHLVQLVQIDPNERVRRQALEEMENGTAATAVPFLMAVSNDRDGQSLRVRQEAVASLGAFDLEDVRDHLNTLAWSDEQERIRKQAIESLADMTSNGSHALLLELARSHPSADTREEAMEQLTDKLDLDF